MIDEIDCLDFCEDCNHCLTKTRQPMEYDLRWILFTFVTAGLGVVLYYVIKYFHDKPIYRCEREPIRWLNRRFESYKKCSKIRYWSGCKGFEGKK